MEIEDGPEDFLGEFWQSAKKKSKNLSGGVKFDEEKSKMDLISPYAIENLAKVLTYGAKKYGANNWRKGIKFSRLIASLKRHLNSFEEGQDYDQESGHKHLAHAMCNIMMLLEFSFYQPKLDDRFDFISYQEKK